MNSNTFPLNNLRVGEKAFVESLSSHGPERRRMLDLGLIQGATVEALHKSPAGDPTAYAIMGAVIALRSEDACKILVSSL